MFYNKYKLTACTLTYAVNWVKIFSAILYHAYFDSRVINSNNFYFRINWFENKNYMIKNIINIKLFFGEKNYLRQIKVDYFLTFYKLENNNCEWLLHQ